MKIILAGCLVWTAAVMGARADVLISQQTKTPAFMMVPAKTEVSEWWLGEGVMATHSPDTSVILDTKAKRMLMLNHDEKSYIETGLPPDLAKLMPPETAQAMSAMMAKMQVSVERAGTTRKVAGLETVAYNVTINMMGMPMVSTYWVAEKGLPFDWKKYQDLNAQLAQISMKGSEAMMKEMAKIQGFPLATEVKIMGMNVVTETTGIQTDATPKADTYQVPAGYKKVEHLIPTRP